MNALTSAANSDATGLLSELAEIYKDIHQNPELSMQEVRTAGMAADWLEANGFEVSRQIGQTGVVGVLKNGEGPTVMLRADMDALAITETTGLPYASTAKARGAQGMIDDGMLERFPKPDIILGQHVMVGEAGTVGYRSGVILSAGDSMKVRLFGRGSHGSQPQTSIDPVIMAASTTMRLQTIVSREIAPIDSAVLTIGLLQAGTKENIIPDEATLKLNIRTYDEGVRNTMLSSIKRICCAECAASNAPRDPEFTTLSTFGRAWKVPYVFWFVGGTDPQTYVTAKEAKKLNEIPTIIPQNLPRRSTPPWKPACRRS